MGRSEVIVNKLPVRACWQQLERPLSPNYTQKRLAHFSPQIHPRGRCATYGERVIFDIPSRPSVYTSVKYIVLRLESCLWTGMGILPKLSTREGRFFESCQPMAGLAASLRGRAVPAGTRGFYRLSPVTPTSRIANQREWGVVPYGIVGVHQPVYVLAVSTTTPSMV